MEVVFVGSCVLGRRWPRSLNRTPPRRWWRRSKDLDEEEADQVEADPIGSASPRGVGGLGVPVKEDILGGSDRGL